MGEEAGMAGIWPLTLANDWVLLEPLTPAHLAALLAVARQVAPDAPFTYVPTTEQALGDYIEASLGRQAEGRELPFAISARQLPGEPIVGTTRFLDLDYWPPPDQPPTWPPGVTRAAARGAPDVAEIGSTWLDPSVQGTAVNSAAKLLLLTHAFETWQVRRVTLKTDARNARSRSSIERLGAVCEGVRRVHVRAVDGGPRDTAYYSILAAEWPACRSQIEARLG
jgi:N-acetyltransferase